jgi:small-conductance mechanosensitive channel
MLRNLSHVLHLSPATVYLLAIAAMLLIGVALGLVLSHLLQRAARGFSGSWREVGFSLLASLPVPLLILVVLYAGLEALDLPARYERPGSQLLSALAVVVLFFFPSKVVTLFLRRMAERKPRLGRSIQFATFATRTVFALLSAYAVLETLRLPRACERFGSKLTAVLAIVLGFYALGKAAELYFGRLNERDPALERITGPASLVARVIFALLATIIVLENLGIHLAAVWTTLGVGSVAIALGLQETLGNLFSGLYLLADRPIRPGDYIKLDSGQEGYVVHVGWRATSIRTLGKTALLWCPICRCPRP